MPLVQKGGAEAGENGGGEEVPGYPEVVAGHLVYSLSLPLSVFSEVVFSS